jgi:hypothetical protein
LFKQEYDVRKMGQDLIDSFSDSGNSTIQMRIPEANLYIPE